MGRYDLCIETCSNYINHIKRHYKILEEAKLEHADKKYFQTKRLKETQFIKTHCHPDINSIDIVNLNDSAHEN